MERNKIKKRKKWRKIKWGRVFLELHSILCIRFYNIGSKGLQIGFPKLIGFFFAHGVTKRPKNGRFKYYFLVWPWFRLLVENDLQCVWRSWALEGLKTTMFHEFSKKWTSCMTFSLMVIYSQKCILKFKVLKLSFKKIFNTHNSTKNNDNIPNFYTWFKFVIEKKGTMFKFLFLFFWR